MTLQDDIRTWRLTVEKADFIGSAKLTQRDILRLLGRMSIVHCTRTPTIDLRRLGLLVDVSNRKELKRHLRELELGGWFRVLKRKGDQARGYRLTLPCSPTSPVDTYCLYNKDSKSLNQEKVEEEYYYSSTLLLLDRFLYISKSKMSTGSVLELVPMVAILGRATFQLWVRLEGARSQTELVRLSGLSRASVSTGLQNLQKWGLVSLQPSRRYVRLGDDLEALEAKLEAIALSKDLHAVFEARRKHAETDREAFNQEGKTADKMRMEKAQGESRDRPMKTSWGQDQEAASEAWYDEVMSILRPLEEEFDSAYSKS